MKNIVRQCRNTDFFEQKGECLCITILQHYYHEVIAGGVFQWFISSLEIVTSPFKNRYPFKKMFFCSFSRYLLAFCDCYSLFRRGVPRLDGARARNKFGVPMFEPKWRSNVLHWKKYLWLCWNFWAPGALWPSFPVVAPLLFRIPFWTASTICTSWSTAVRTYRHSTTSVPPTHVCYFVVCNEREVLRSFEWNVFESFVISIQLVLSFQMICFPLSIHGCWNYYRA